MPDLMFDEGVERIFTEIDPTTRAPGVHIMTGPIYVEGAEPGDMLEVRYLSMEPRNPYGSNLAANWGHLYQEFDEKERVTIYRLDAQTQTASALYAYDFPGKYLVPGTITNCPVCDRQPALPGVTIPARPHLGTAGVAPAVNEPVSTIPRPPRRQHRQLAHRRGRDDVLQVPGQGRAVLDRRSPCQPGRRRDFRHGDRKLAQLPVPDHPAQGFRVPLAAARNAKTLDRPRLWRHPRPGDEIGLDGHAQAARRTGRPSKNDAYSLMSVASDFGVTQVVDGTLGVHVRVNRDMFPARGVVKDPG
jgi:acetamidase/formamidase